LVAGKYTAGERAQVQQFIERLYERSGARSWAAFARQAGVSELGLSAWRSGREMPGAVNLLRLLAAVGLIGPGYELPENGETSRFRSLEGEVAHLALLVREVFGRLEGLLQEDLAEVRRRLAVAEGVQRTGVEGAERVIQDLEALAGRVESLEAELGRRRRADA
jgi:transcriptional regulator with XRE-family HTH domain